MAWVAQQSTESSPMAERGSPSEMENGIVGAEENGLKNNDTVKSEYGGLRASNGEHGTSEESHAYLSSVTKMKSDSPIQTSLLPDSPSPEPFKAEDDEDRLPIAERDQKRSGSSRLTSPDEVRKATKKKGTVRWSSAGPTQTVEHLPLAREDAMRTFTEIKSNHYQHNKVGRSKGHEKDAMTCECRYKHGIDDPMMACGEDAGCINRLTQVECREADCNCGKHCRNQRFQKHQFADVEIVQTEKKGFGLRAREDLPADAFIYEYIGEVVEQDEFMARMQQYKDEGIRHYYFMMLQRAEFIDATKKGGVARFINHSCNPNCYVSKWHVGKHMRMGIFSKRAIVENEELTFNYNVDRYGNEAQPCYCGEPNCVGSIGGKTQTDIGGMDQLFIDALGIADEVDRVDARGTRRKKSRHLDDEDFNPTLHSMQEEEVAKVVTAVRQAASNRTILQKLLTRIHMTRDTDVQRSLVRLHGFVLMAAVLEEWKDDKEIVLLVMGSLARWPLIARNKVVDSGVDELIKEMSDASDAEIASLARDLLSAWDALEMSYRIARREGNAAHSTLSFEHRKSDESEDIAPVVTLREARAPNSISTRLETIAPKPLVRSLGTISYPRSTSSSGHLPGNGEPRGTPLRARFRKEGHASSPLSASQTSAAAPRQGASIEEIIRKANESEAAQRKRAEEAAMASKEESLKAQETKKTTSLSLSLKRKPSSRSSTSVGEKKRRTSDAGKSGGGSMLESAERRLKKAVGEVVVRCMSSFKEDLNRDVFKKHAKELTTIICDKEKRNPKVWPPHGDASNYLQDGFGAEKKGKIKAFASDYVRKLIAHKAGKRESNLGDTPASGSRMEGIHSDAKDEDDLNSIESSDEGDEVRGESDGHVDSPSVGSQNGAARLSEIKSAAQAASSTSSTATTTSTDVAAPRTPLDPTVISSSSVGKM